MISQTDFGKAATICVYLAQRGHLVDFIAERDEIKVTPTPAMAIVERLIANEAMLVAYFQALEHRPATGHAFAPMANLGVETACTLGVCLECGIPWGLHGEPAESSWKPVTDLKSVRTRRCAPIWKSEIAA